MSAIKPEPPSIDEIAEKTFIYEDWAFVTRLSRDMARDKKFVRDHSTFLKSLPDCFYVGDWPVWLEAHKEKIVGDPIMIGQRLLDCFQIIPAGRAENECQKYDFKQHEYFQLTSHQAPTHKYAETPWKGPLSVIGTHRIISFEAEIMFLRQPESDAAHSLDGLLSIDEERSFLRLSRPQTAKKVDAKDAGTVNKVKKDLSKLLLGSDSYITELGLRHCVYRVTAHTGDKNAWITALKELSAERSQLERERERERREREHKQLVQLKKREKAEEKKETERPISQQSDCLGIRPRGNDGNAIEAADAETRRWRLAGGEAARRR